MKIFFLKILTFLENKNKFYYYNSSFDTAYFLFLRNLGIGDLIMLSPIIKTLNESNKFKKIKIVTWIPNIFQEKIEIISFKNFLKEIFLLKNNYVLVSPTVNIIHSLFVLIRKPCFGFFSNNHFFSNIHKYQINFKFDPINSHFNKRLFPFLALFKIKKIKYLKLKKKKN